MIKDIIDRIEYAKTYVHPEFNCISFGYFAVGIDQNEVSRIDGFLESTTPQLIRVPTFQDALLVGTALRQKDKYVLHLDVIDPSNRDKLVFREGMGGEIAYRNTDFVLKHVEDSVYTYPVFFGVDFSR